MTATRPQTIVLLHALSLTSTMWQAQAEALRAEGHHVLTPDQRGFAATPLGDDPPSLNAAADDLARLLDATGHPQAVLAGCSLGAYTAMTFLARHPGRTLALALISARATADTPETRAQRRQFAQLIQDPDARAAVIDRTTPMLLGPTTRTRHPDLLAHTLTQAHAADPAALAWTQAAIADRADATATLAATHVPALVLHGAEDALVTAAESAHTAAALPDGHLITLPATGHLPPLEAPDAVTHHLRALVERIP
ncbi:alpha/beta fold hydrolase [Streptomyces purpureus]|uniref:alpha/beta fold hydrolase n=1 Tax=Streptomyces purpureus TaxID=1951 RepID=UPI00036CED92|nr:alpha/beta hydrolase [Streptomyces purpureus]